MKQHSAQKQLCFDDVLLVPGYSSVISRHSVDLRMTIGKNKNSFTLLTPIIASPMDTVCDVEMCVAMAKEGGLGILHRYMSEEDQIQKTKMLASHVDHYGFGVAVGATNGYLQHSKSLVDAGATILLVDTANGHSSYAIEAVVKLKQEFGEGIHIMAGNVATLDGFKRLSIAGADSIRVGIGGGSACTTRIVSGHGIPTLASIMEIAEWSKESPTSIVADGGIRNSGDIAKSFAAGADAVMLGSMLAGTDESPGDIMTDAYGRDVKSFRGMASASAQHDAFKKVSVAEGIATTVLYKGSVSHILDQIRGGLGSACSYSGVYHLSSMYEEAEYVKVSALSINESKPHAAV